MKVAFLSFHFGEYSVILASALAKEAEVLLCLDNHRAAPHLSRLNPAVSFQPFSQPRLRQPLRQMNMIYHILKQVWRFDPDVIHIQNGHLWFNLALPFLRHYPLVITIHDPKPHYGDRESGKKPQLMKIWDFGHHRANQLIVHGEQLKQTVVDELGFPKDVVHVVPMVALGDGMALNQLQEDDHQILFFGRIWEYKGLEYLIRAEPFITAQIPDVKIVIAGRGEDFSRYRRLMVHPERFTIYNEYISHQKRDKLFQQASVVALPYIDASQSAIIPIAYMFAKPVVATAVGGLPELVDQGCTGFLVPPRDERALADAIIYILLDKNLRYQLGTNAKRKVETELSPEAIAHQTLKVYRRAIGDEDASA